MMDDMGCFDCHSEPLPVLSLSTNPTRFGTRLPCQQLNIGMGPPLLAVPGPPFTPVERSAQRLSRFHQLRSSF
jgi:hypothetical protein